MATSLFGSIIFGPIKSRRLGVSLGVNLLPSTGKVCSFDCVYCECGYNAERKGGVIPNIDQVKAAMSEKLEQMHSNGDHRDVITFAGNGEPTMHPNFGEIIDYTISLRDKYYPNAKVSVLSNSTRIDRPDVFNALLKVDNNILKIDSAIQHTLDLINAPVGSKFDVEKLVSNLASFNGKVIIQTLFLRGRIKGEDVDNTKEEEVVAWLEAMKKIKPASIMVYSLDRPTPAQELIKVDKEELEIIAQRARELGFEVSVS